MAIPGPGMLRQKSAVVKDDIPASAGIRSANSPGDPNQAAASGIQATIRRRKGVQRNM
jgi:hypothetical protein